MENAGPSLYGGPGQSLFVPTLVNNTQQEEEDDDEQAEDERQRLQEMEGILRNELSDLEESELHQSLDYSQPIAASCDDDHHLQDKYSLCFDKINYEAGRKLNNANINNYDSNAVPVIHQLNSCDRNYDINDDLSDRSSPPWSEGSPSLVSSNYNDLHPVGVHLNLPLADNSYGDGKSGTAPEYSLDGRSDRVPEYSGDRRTNEPLLHKCLDNIGTASDIQHNYMTAASQHDQLKVLYEARGRELDRLSTEIEMIRAEKNQQCSELNHEITLLKGEREQLEVSRSQSQILLKEKDNQLNCLKTDLNELLTQFSESKTNLTKMKVKLESSEILIKTLEQNISDLQSTDSLRKSRRMHEDFLTKLQGSHQSELNTLHSKLNSTNIRLQEEEHRITELRTELQLVREKQECVLLEKGKVISDLKGELMARQQQCEALLSNYAQGVTQQVRQENEALRDDKNHLQEEIQNLQRKLVLMKEDHENYGIVLKLGLFSAVSSEDSITALNLKPPCALTYEDTLSSAEQVDTSQHSLLSSCSQREREIQKELERALYALKRRGDQVIEVDNELRDKILANRKMKAQLKSHSVDIKEQAASIERLTLEKNRLQDEIACANSKYLVCLGENTQQQRELAAALAQVPALRDAGQRLDLIVNMLENSNLMPNNDVLRNIKSTVEALQASQQVLKEIIEELKAEQALLTKNNYVFVDKVNEISCTLQDMLSKTQHKRTSDSATNMSVSSLVMLLEEFKICASQVKVEHFKHLGDQLQSENELCGLKTSIQKLQNENLSNKEQIALLTSELLEEKKKLQCSSVDSCKEDYLKFHEDSLNKFRENFYNLRSQLEENIGTLQGELSDVKSQYILVCQEKKQLEDVIAQLKHSMENTMLVNKLEKSKEKMLLRSGDHVSVKKLGNTTSTQTDSNDSTSAAGESLAGLVQHSSLEGMVHNLGCYLLKINEKLSEQIEELNQDYNMKEIAERLDSYREQFRSLENQCDLVLGSSRTRDSRSPHSCGAPDSRAAPHETAQPVVAENKASVEMLKKEALKVRANYESQLQCLQEQCELLVQTNKDLVTECLRIKSLHENADQQRQHHEVLVFLNKLSSFEKTIKDMASDHEKVVCQLSDEVQTLESDLKESNNARLQDQKRFQHLIENTKLEKSCFMDEIANLKTTLLTTRQEANKKNASCVEKYRKLERNFKKLQVRSEEIISHYKNEAIRQSRGVSSARAELLTNFDAWLLETRTLLKKGVELVLKLLRPLPGKDVWDQADLVEPVETLQVMLKTLQDFKLHPELLQEIDSNITQVEDKALQD